jgi:hypothetical protein
MMMQCNDLSDTGQFLTPEMQAYDGDVTDEPVDAASEVDRAELGYAAAMQRELEEMQEALDEISQYVIY